MAKEKISPGMQQYLDIKENYPDAFLLFRMGDFYELFYEDAVKAAQILEISLTSRNKNADNPIPMAGVPYHSAQAYIDVLVEMGYKVAIAEQMEDPKQAVGVVKREVVQVITPGTVVDSSKPDNANNFLVAIDKAGSRFGLAYMDVSTGEFFATELDDFSSVCSEIQNLKAREVVVGYDLPEADEQVLVKQLNLLLSKETEVYDDVHLIDTSLTDLESSVAGKLLSMCTVLRCASLAIYKRLSTMRLRITCRCPMRPSQVWICWKMLEQVRNTVLFSGSWMKPRQLWECVSYELGLTVL